MGTTRKAPSGVKHDACRHHEPYASAPADWLCFSDASAPTDETILERMVWADDLEASRAAHRAAWAERLALAPTGETGHAPRPYDPGIFVPTDSALRPMTAEELAESERAEAATAAAWRAAMIRNPKTYGMTRQQADRLAAYGEAEAA